MGQGDLPTSRRGPFRRRREKRQLEQLADGSREALPGTATAHVRVIEDQGDVMNQDHLDPHEPDSPGDAPLKSRPGGFHVRAVPIDQPIGE
jgi:hypothetical protein